MTHPASNPFADGQRLWNDHVGRVAAERSWWRIAAIGQSLISLVAICGVIYLAPRTRFIPYVVEIDRAGTIEAVKRATEMPPAERTNVETQLRTFIRMSRRVSLDRGLNQSSVDRLFEMMSASDPAPAKLEKHLSTWNPGLRAARETVRTHTTSVLPISEESWQVEWEEIVHSRKGQLQERFEMQAIVHVVQVQPDNTDEEAFAANPLGIWIRDFEWNRKQQDKEPTK